MIRLDHVCRRYRSRGLATVVADDICATFPSGVAVALLGHNGAGKSSLLRIMAGLDTDFQGEARPAKGINVGYLPQEPELDPALDVRGNVMEGVAKKRALLDRYTLFGPPALMFFGKNGSEKSDQRVIGEINAADFAERVAIANDQI